LKSIGVSDSANDTFRKEAKKLNSINQQYNDNAPALKQNLKKNSLQKELQMLTWMVKYWYYSKQKNDSVSKAVASQLTTKAIRHKADSDGDANNSQLIAEIDSASEDGWVLIGSQIALT
jgi:pyrroloquinoline quinone (PQQ) biosynthesis protein C